MDVKQKIQACLAEIDALLLEAKCDGELVHNLQCFEDLDESLNILQGYVESICERPFNPCGSRVFT